MAKKYQGSLTLEWFNKQKSIINLDENDIKSENDIPAPAINWINKEDSLFYEISEEEGKGKKPYWVDRNDIRVKEARPLVFQKAYKAIEVDKEDSLPGTIKEYKIKEITDENEAQDIENILIKGDNLLALNTLKQHFDKLPDDQKVKCIYIDPPYNTGKAFEHYEDNLEISTWLTLMRDRLNMLHKLLCDDGVIFIQLDEKLLFHLKLLLDDIFGRNNFINIFTIKTSDPSGFKTVNPSPYDAAEYILMFSKYRFNYNYDPIYVSSSHDFGYNKYIPNIDDDYSDWEVVGLNQYIAEKEGYESTRKAKLSLTEVVFNTIVSEFAIKNCNSIFQGTAIGNDAGRDMVELRNYSKVNKGKFHQLIRENGNVEYAFNGRQVYFYKNKIKQINGKYTPTMQLTNIWNDIPYNGISGEGNVVFAESKKPELLINRLFTIANVNPGDFVLDSYSGSGTSVAVANKMGANYIGVELGDHCDTLIIPRLKDVLLNRDPKGVSSILNWHGGGSFKYYHLGESIIKFDEDTKNGDFNWSLGIDFIQESLLISYDFVIQNFELLSEQLFEIEAFKPTIGKITGKSNTSIYALAILSSPDAMEDTISNDQIKEIYSILKSKSDFQSLVLFTNMGIDLASDTIPEDFEIIKVPHAIFSSLED